MTYRVRYGAHPEALRSGRMVGPGDELTDDEALENLPLIDRGVIHEAEDAAPPAPARATPAARKLAEKHGIDLGQVTGTGSGGEIKDDDVKKAIEQAASSAGSDDSGDEAANEPPSGEKGGAL